GGEPLMRDDCIEIIEYAASLDLLISLGTNGTLIDKTLAKLLSEFPIKIQISLDGAIKETHETVRGEGSFDLAIRGIDSLINEGMSKDIVIAFTPMKPNLNEIPDIVDFALRQQIPVVQFPPLTSSGRAKMRWNELRLSNDEMLWFWEFVSKKSEELRGKMDLLADCFSININNTGSPRRCSIGTQFRIDPEGYVYPCQCFHFGSEYCLGNVKEKSLKDIMYGQRIKEIKEICFQRPFNIDECRKCKWKNFCGSGCMGNIFESSGTILNSESCEVRKKWIEKLFEVKLKEIST
ncbi:MAG TPA: radical SAM protein, partial [Nitrospirae bacterium]|nr:radical SAM protein [Nitrospirota bacterium]